jgi:hypothetical protein
VGRNTREAIEGGGDLPLFGLAGREMGQAIVEDFLGGGYGGSETFDEWVGDRIAGKAALDKCPAGHRDESGMFELLGGDAVSQRCEGRGCFIT